MHSSDVARVERAGGLTASPAGVGHGEREVRAVRTAALFVVSGALLSGPIAMAAVALVRPQPAWASVHVMATSYHPVQALPYLLGFVLLYGFVTFAAAAHRLAAPALRARSTAALLFTGVYATLVFLNYTLQVGFVPRALAREDAAVALLTMANPASIAWFLEMFGYAALGVATWLLAPVFREWRRGRVIAALLVINGAGSILAAALTAAIDRFVFTTGGMIAFGTWNLLVPVCFALIAVSRPEQSTLA